MTLNDLAAVLGLGRDIIAQALRQGRTLKDLAVLAGISLDDTIAGLLAHRRNQMEQRLAKFGQDLQDGAGNALLPPHPRWVHPQGPTGGRFFGAGRGIGPQGSRFLPLDGPPEPHPEPPATPPPGSPSDPPNEW